MRFMMALTATGIVVYCTVVMLTFFYLHLHKDPAPLPVASAIVVLSGPGSVHPIPVDDTRERVERGVELWKAGVAPRIIMTGSGPSRSDFGLPDSRGMRRLAEELGVPEHAITEESNSYSTLQNAWFTAEIDGIERSAPVVVVTNRYHLPRSWASFRWAGFKDVTMVAADDGPPVLDGNLLWEGVKWPFNVARAAGATAALHAGTPEADVLPWLE